MLLSLVFAGCQKDTTTATDTTGDNTSETVEQTTTEPVTITIWEQMDPSAQDVFDEVAAAFMAEYPDITVVREHYETEDLRTQFQTAALAGQGPELIYGPSDNIGLFSTAGIIAPVTDYVSADFLAGIAENALGDGNIGGVQYSVPDINGNQIALVYNKALVSEAPDTWDELVATALTVRANTDDAENATYGFLYNEKEPFWFIGIFNGFGGDVMDDSYNPTLNTEAMVKALQFAKDVTQTYNVGLSGMDYDTEDGMFKEGKAGMILMGAWAWSSYQEAGMDIGIVPGPVLPGGNRMTFYSSTKGYSVSVSADPAKKDAIEKFFNFVFMPENNAKFALANSQAPTVKAAAELDEIKNNELQQIAVSTIEYTVPMPIVAEMRAIWDAIKPELSAVLYEGKDPADAAEAMQEAAVEGIATIRGE